MLTSASDVNRPMVSCEPVRCLIAAPWRMSWITWPTVRLASLAKVSKYVLIILFKLIFFIFLFFKEDVFPLYCACPQIVLAHEIELVARKRGNMRKYGGIIGCVNVGNLACSAKKKNRPSYFYTLSGIMNVIIM